MLTLVISVSVVLLASAICAITEAALFFVPLLKVQQLAQSKKMAAVALLAIRENMQRPIAAIVILTNIANIVGSIAVGGIAARVLGSQWLGLFSGLLTFLFIIFAEIIPKTLGERYAVQIALFVARPILAITQALIPLIWLIERITAPVTQGEQTAFTTNEAEIRLLAKIGQKEGIIEPRESDLVQRAFELNNTTAADLMTPRVAMTYLAGQATLADSETDIINSEHSRIIVVENTPDEVLGVALKDELLAAIINDRGEEPVARFTHPAQFVPETERADRLLATFQKSRQHLAVVMDDYAGVSGVVTLEDVLEILTGEIVDETDQVIDLQAAAKARRAKKMVD